MKKGGGKREEAKKLADKFQQDIIDVIVANDEIDVENRVITDKDVDGDKPKKRTDKPSNFVSEQRFQSGVAVAPQESPGGTNHVLDRDLRARIEGQRRSERHGRHGPAQDEPGRVDVPRLGLWRAASALRRRPV